MEIRSSFTVLIFCAFVHVHVQGQSDSCQGRCGQGLNSAYSCQCNSACVRYGDCCTDYSPICQGESCAGRCNTEDLRFSCQCTSDCSTFGDCCSDYKEVCSIDSCRGRCGPGHDYSYTCQCNTGCVTYGDCCHDYQALCQSNGAGGSISGSGTDPVSALMNDIWLSDVNRMSDSDVQVNHFGNKLFTYVNTAKLYTGTFQLFINLLDNYNPNIGQAEPSETAQERQEVESFLDSILATEVIELTYQFLLSAGEITSRANFRAALEEMWFNFYPRSSSNNIVDSSGFEHVLVGELKSTSVSGFHSWIQFYLEEQAGRLNYDQMVSSAEPNLKGAKFYWNGKLKSKGSFFLGTSPEFDVAVYTICAMLYPGSRCNFDLQGNPISIQTYDVSHKAGIQIATAYPAV